MLMRKNPEEETRVPSSMQRTTAPQNLVITRRVKIGGIYMPRGLVEGLWNILGVLKGKKWEKINLGLVKMQYYTEGSIESQKE